MTPTSSGIELDPAIEKKLLGWLVFVLVIVALMAGAAIQNNSRQAESAAWVNHTHAFILETDAILSSLHAAEAAQRTFLLTGDVATKQLTLERFAEMDEHLKVATKLAFENSNQQKRLEGLSVLLQKQIDFNKQAAQLRGQDPPAGAGVFTNALARANVVAIEREIAAGKAEENRLLHEREQKLQRHTARTEQILYAGAVLNLILLCLAFYVVRMDLNLRRQATAILETKVKERTAELAAANDKLQIENMEQKWGQAALSRVVRHHELILNSIREAIFVISRNGRIISTNPAAVELIGGEAAGKSIAAFLQETAEANQPWEKHFLARAVKEGAALQPVTAFLKSKAGAVRTVRVACHAARDHDNLTGAVIVVSTESHLTGKA